MNKRLSQSAIVMLSRSTAGSALANSGRFRSRCGTEGPLRLLSETASCSLTSSYETYPIYSDRIDGLFFLHL